MSTDPASSRTIRAAAAILLLLTALSGCARERVTLLADEFFTAVVAGEDGEQDFGALNRAARKAGYNLIIDVMDFDPRQDAFSADLSEHLEALAGSDEDDGGIIILSPLLSAYMLMEPEESSAVQYLQMLPSERIVLWLDEKTAFQAGFLGAIRRDRRQGWYAAGVYAASEFSDGSPASAFCLTEKSYGTDVASSFRDGLREGAVQLLEPFNRDADDMEWEELLDSLPGTVLLGLDTGLQTEEFLSTVQGGKVIPVGEYIDALVSDQLPCISIRDDFAGTIGILLQQLQQGTGTVSVDAAWRIVSTIDR